jgi:hypothetical protein
MCNRIRGLREWSEIPRVLSRLPLINFDCPVPGRLPVTTWITTQNALKARAQEANAYFGRL